MRPIVVGVDFSDCSINALEHAISIANRAEIDVQMLWVKKQDESLPEYFRSDKDPVVVVDEHFQRLIDKYQPEFKTGKLLFTIREGKVNKEMVDFATEQNAFLLIIGTHGSSGFEEMWIGSNANKVVSQSPCPIITIRGGVSIGRDLERIVVPIDSTLETRQKVPFATVIAKLFNAEVHVVLMLTTKVTSIRRQVEEYAQQAIKYFHENKVKYKVEYLESKSIVDDLINYSKSVDANLIAIMTEMEKSTWNLWLGSYAQQLVNHSPIPVLTIHAKEVLSSGGAAF